MLEQEQLEASLADPHPESVALAEAGLDEWPGTAATAVWYSMAGRLLSDPLEEKQLVDPAAGTEIRWVEGEGWVGV